MKITVWVLSTCIPYEHRPCRPEVFATEAEARKRFDQAMREEWDQNGDYDDDGNSLPYPDTPEEAVRAIETNMTDGSWGSWELTQHNIEVVA